MAYIMNVETVKIKDYLFSTNKLKCIQGASYLLDYINNVGIRRILNKYDIKNTEISFHKLKNIFEKNLNIQNEIYDLVKEDDIFYIAAGNAKFIVKEDLNLKNIENEIIKLYKYLAPGIKVVIEVEKIEENSNYAKLISNLSRKTNQRKSVGFEIENLDLPMIKKCDLSNKENAEISYDELKNIENLSQIIYPNFVKSDKYDFVFEEILAEIIEKIDLFKLRVQFKNLVGEEGYISRETLMKIIFSNFMREANEKISFYSQVFEKFPDIDTNMTIEEYPSKDSFIGFLYSDGDSLGEFLKNNTVNKENEDYLKFIKPFSIILDYITRSSLIDALIEVFNRDSKKIGAFFIVGGDDVCALFEANESIKVLKKYIEVFNDKMKKIGYEGISTSAGLLFAKSKVPIYLMMRQSLVLQKNAKQKRYLNKSKLGYIDFQNIGSQGNANINKYRESQENNVSEKPYSIIEFGKILNIIDKLRKSKFSTTKLRYFYDVLSNDKYNIKEKNMLIINAIINSENNSVINEIWKEFNENIDEIIFKEKKILNNILDVIELFDFTLIEKGDNNE